MKQGVSLIASLLIAITLATTAVAQNYNFSATTSTGQTLYYRITDNSTYTVAVTHPAFVAWDGYTKPTGSLEIPATVLYNSISYTVGTIDEYAFNNCSGLTSVTIGGSVTSIGYYAFQSCSGLTSLTIPNSVTSIGEYAFYNCSGLTSLTIPNSVTSIGQYAFCNCRGLTSVTIPNSVTSIGVGSFRNCSSLTSVTIPNSVTSIYGDAFCYCSGLTSVTIPNSVTSIGGHAFQSCSGLTSVTIPNSVTSIGQYAFYGCSGINGSLIIPNSVTSIGQYAFSDCSGLTSVTIPNSVTSIGSAAFSGCSGLTSIVVASGNTHYDSRNNCNAIIKTATNALINGCQNTIIPNSVTSIGDYAFYNCSGLTSLTIPNSVTSIGNYAFYNCSGLTSVVFNADSCIRAGGTGNYAAFNNCSNLTSFTFGNNVKRIPDGLCYGLSSLTSVTIPNSVTSIGDGAFQNCSGLTSVVFNADSCILARTNPFSNCSNLISFTFGNSVKWIPNYLCYGLSSLTFVTIGDSVTSIGDFAFSNCTGLDTLHMLAETPPTIYSNTFQSIATNLPVTVPCGSKNAYNDAQYWNAFTKILEHDSCNNTLTLTANDASRGSVLGAGRYRPGSTVEIMAVPKAGCQFVRWNDNNTTNPRSISLTSDTSFTAFFDTIVAVASHTITVISANAAMGTAMGGGTYTHGTAALIVAVPGNGYAFLSWHDGNTANPRTVTVTENTFYIASFTTAPTGIQHDTITLRDTITNTMTDTAFVNVYIHDTTTLRDTITNIITDTAFVDNYIYDTTTIHDTVEVVNTIYSTDTVTATDTLYITNTITEYDTVTAIDTFYVTDIVTVYDTIIAIDTFYVTDVVTVYDTLYSTVIRYQYVHDTTFVDRYFYDTTVVNNYIHDTTVVDHYVHDTVRIIRNILDYVYDTIYQQTTVYVHDTLFVDHYIHDTTLLTTYVHDTLYLNRDIHDTTYINNYIHDTTLVTDYVHDTTYVTNTVHDTTVVTDYIYDTTTITEYIHDTLYLYLHDTLYLRDTVYIHDTVYIGGEGISAASVIDAKVYSHNGQVVVEGADGNAVTLYDITGRILATRRNEQEPLRFDVPASGAYLIKIGHHAPHKVVVIK